MTSMDDSAERKATPPKPTPELGAPSKFMALPKTKLLANIPKKVEVLGTEQTKVAALVNEINKTQTDLPYGS